MKDRDENQRIVLCLLEGTKRALFHTKRSAAVELQWFMFDFMEKYGWIPEEDEHGRLTGDFIKGDYAAWGRKKSQQVFGFKR
jgi:hypothetical protein